MAHSSLNILPGVVLLTLIIGARSAFAEAELVVQSPPIYAQPTSLSLDSKGELLFVADRGHNEIKVLVAANLDLLGEFGRDQLRAPHSVHLSANQQLIVADSGNDRLVEYSVNGTSAKVGQIFDVNLKDAQGACRLDDQTLFATSHGSNHVVKFDDSGVSQKTKTGINGSLPFFRPRGIACDSASGRIILADSGNDRLVVLDADLNFTAAIGGRKLGFNQPSDVSIGDDGFIFVADQNNDRIVVLDAQFALVDTIGGDILTQPTGVISRGNLVWVADTFAEQIVLFKWQRPQTKVTQD